MVTSPNICFRGPCLYHSTMGCNGTSFAVFKALLWTVLKLNYFLPKKYNTEIKLTLWPDSIGGKWKMFFANLDELIFQHVFNETMLYKGLFLFW